MSAGFNVGDRVKLKSGGPDMTVVSTEGFGETRIYTMWFDSSGKKHDADFPPDALERAPTGRRTIENEMD